MTNELKEPEQWRDAIYYAYYENAAVHNVPMHDGVRTEKHKLMFFPRTSEWQLFDLEKDPHEMTSVHQLPQYAQLLETLKAQYKDMRQHYAVNSAIIPTSRKWLPWWALRHRGMNNKAKKGGHDLVFIGDSITQGWAKPGKEVWKKHFGPRKPLNLGISGDRTEHVIWRLQNGNLINVAPKVAVVMIGTNNTGHKLQEPTEVAEGVKQILDILVEECPDTQIVLHAIFPRGTRSDNPGRLNNIAINKIIQRYSDHERIHYLDIADAFLEEDGTLPPEIMPDALHLSPEGYQRWADALEPTLQELGL